MVPSLPRFSSNESELLFFSPAYNIIIEHQYYKVLSNIPIQKNVMKKNLMITHFHTFVRPKYFVFLANQTDIFFMPGSNHSKVRVDMWCGMHCAFAHQIVQNITLYLFDKWKRLNETWQINHVAIPDFPEKESIINLGVVIYREADVTYIENVDSVARKIKVTHFIAQKVIQECSYYENPLWPLSSLLNEAIVTFLGLYVTNQAIPSTRMMDLFVVQIQQESLHFDTEYNTSLYNTSFNISFEHYSYIKVPGILRRLQDLITKEIFWQSIRIYVKDNKPTLNYFGEIMKNLLYNQKSTYKSTYNLTHIKELTTVLLKSPIKRIYYTVMEVVRDYKTYYYSIKPIKRLISNLNKSADDYISDSTELHNFMLYNIRPPEFFLVYNFKVTGYYRVNYDIENWRRITNYLNSKNYNKIHVLNRAQIIDDAFHLMITNQLNSTVFWNITKYLSQETDYVAWYPMFKALEYLSNIFLFHEKIYFDIKMKVLILLYKLLDSLKYNELDSNEHDLTKSLRMEAAKWACNLDGRICIETAQHKLNRHLEDPENNTLLPWWEEWTYCQGLKILYYSLDIEDSPINKESPWWRVYHLGKEKFKPKLLKFLSCPEDSKFIKPYLNLIKNDSTTSIIFLKDLSDKDYINYFLFTIAKHARNPVVLVFILEELENIRPRQISEYATLTVIINHVYSTNQLEKINDFFTNKFFNVTQVQLNECEKLSPLKERNMKIKNVLMLHYPKTSNLTQSAEYFRCIQQYTSNIETKIQMQYILNIESKIQMRFFEIKSQQNYFQNFVKYPEGETFFRKRASKKNRFFNY
ncbi:aminopeptidase N-like [Camponotus floridanus]|uniref:aminopeptidase N-like n=1 Tax=Camponotus floridanus TaxID=104421 RepID=UPI000DC6A3F6|nr:aminopeptidase N-like [Camponotus floridanus]